MKNQEMIMRAGDKVLYRVEAPIKPGLGYNHGKDYPGVVIVHNDYSTHIEIVGDDCKTHSVSVEYNDFNGGYASCTLQLERDEIRRRQQKVVKHLSEMAEREHAAKLEKIRNLFDDCH
ncbi:hypothetical protein ACYPKM_01150 [Pseudomonas aeruginosa]